MRQPGSDMLNEASTRNRPTATQAPDGEPRPRVEPPAGSPAELRVVGNQLQTHDGQVVWLQGVNVASLEWKATGDHVLRSIGVAIDDWQSNVIRLPVKETFWFGEDDQQADGGAAYRQLIDQAVEAAASRGAYLILDLHRYRAPTQAHADFWQDAAGRYANHPAVLFDLINEPHGISWEVWRHGGTVEEKRKRDDVIDENEQDTHSFHSVGMPRLVQAVRDTGARNVIIAGGLDWSYDLTGIMAGHALEEPGGNGIMYTSHVYPWKAGWADKFLMAAEKYPILIGEVGAPLKRMPFIPPERHEDPYRWSPDMIALIQKHRLHWTAWCFHPKASPVILQDWDYTPTPYWGAFVKAALRGARFELGRMR